jgi:hypothetical protein
VQAIAHLAGGVLDRGQNRRPEPAASSRGIVEVFGVGRDLLKDTPSGFDVSQVQFTLIFAPALLQESVLTPDALQSAMAEGEIELSDESVGTEGGQLLAQSDDLLFDDERNFAGLMTRGAGEFDHASRP